MGFNSGFKGLSRVQLHHCWCSLYLVAAVAITAVFIFQVPLPRRNNGVPTVIRNTTARWSVKAAGTVIILVFFAYNVCDIYMDGQFVSLRY